MTASNFIFEQGEAIDVGAPVENDYTYDEGDLVSDGDESTFVYIDGRGLGAAGVVWYLDRRETNKFYELDQQDLSVVRSGNAKTSGQDGCGGTPNVIWSGDRDNPDFYELSPTDFSTVRKEGISFSCDGCAGKDDVLGAVDNGSELGFIDLSTSDFSILRNDTSYSKNLSSAAAHPDQYWHFVSGTTDDGKEIAERDPSDLSVTAAFQPNYVIQTGGGTPNAFWVTQDNNFTGKDTREVDPSDYSEVQAVDITDDGHGIDGV